MLVYRGVLPLCLWMPLDVSEHLDTLEHMLINQLYNKAVIILVILILIFTIVIIIIITIFIIIITIIITVI